MLTVLLTLHSPWESLVALLMGSPSTETSSDKGKRVTTPFLLSMKQCWFSTPVPCITISCGTGASSVPKVVLPGTNEKKIQCGYIIMKVDHQIRNQQISFNSLAQLLAQVITRTTKEQRSAHVHEQLPL